MCRRNRLRGCLLLGIGIGLVTGYCLDSWLICTCGGIGLLILGLMIMSQK